MAKKATGKSGSKNGGGSKASGSKSGSGTGTAVVRASGREDSGSREKFDASEALLKLLQSPLVAELIAVAATAALAALAEQGFASGTTRGKRAGSAAKAASKAAAAAVGRRLSTEFEEIRKAATGAKDGASA